MFQLKILQKKLEGHQKKYKFVTNKTEICLFCYSFIFMKLRLNFQMINLNEKDEKVTYRQHATKLFSILRLLLFSVINTFEESLCNDDI